MTETPKTPSQQPNAIQSILDGFLGRVDSWGKSQRTTYAVATSVAILVLAVAASLPLWEGLGLRWVSTVIAAPAGVLLFFLGLAVVHSTGLKEWALFRTKEMFPPRIRVIYVIMGLLAIGSILLFSAAWMPVGAGGTIVIATALTAYNTIRRSPEELRYAQLGLPDPREVRILQEAEEEAEAVLANEDGTIVIREDDK